MSGESEVRLLGSVVSRCEDTFEASINENGVGAFGYSSEQHHSLVGNPGCTRIPCNGQGESFEEHPFRILNAEETMASTAELSIRFCLDASPNPNATGPHCTADVFVEDMGAHNYRLSTHQSCFNGVGELRGTWSTIADSIHDTIEIRHI